MKNLYMVKVFLLILLIGFPIHNVFSHYVSTETGGEFNDPSSWMYGVVPTQKSQEITIVQNSEITYDGDFSWDQKVTINGDFTVVNNLSAGHGGVVVNGTLRVLNAFNGNLIVESGAIVRVKSFSGGTFEVKSGGVLIVEDGNCTLTNHSFIRNNGKVEIYGDFNLQSDIVVESNGVLIVHKRFAANGNWGMDISGNIIVKEDFTVSNGKIENTGKVIVGGAFKFNGGGFSSPSGNNNLYLLDSLADHTYAYSTIDEKRGTLEDFLENEADTDLIDLVSSVMPEWVPPGSSNRKYQWVGSQSSDWEDDRNWNGMKPVSRVNVIIKESNNNPNITLENGFIELNNLTIESGAVLTLKPGARLTVHGDLAIKKSGGLVLENHPDADGLASLITHGSVTGEVEVNLTLLNKRWYYLSSPMKEVDYTHFGSEEEDAQVFVYRNNKWVQYLDASLSNPVGLEGATIGFGSSEPTTTIRYSGEINTDPVSRDLKTRGYHLLGNPYPASINWETISSANSEIYPSMWYRTKIKREMSYITYNSTGPEGGKVSLYPDTDPWGDDTDLALIPPYQSVWIYSRTASATKPVSVNVEPSQRDDGTEIPTLKSSREKVKADVVRVMVENESSRDGAVIYFSEKSTDDFDSGDSQKYFNDSERIPEIYTRASGQTLAINGLAPFERALDLPLSVRNRVEGSVDMKFDLSHYNSEDVILLRDEYEDVEINLRKVNQYSYEPVGLGDNHDRFVLRFNPTGYEDVSTTIFDETERQGSNQINIIGINGRAIVSISRELLAQGAGKIEVYSIDGIKLSESEVRTNKTFLVLPDQTGVYIVVVSASGERKVKKLLR